jgi:hypothetical protein
MALAVLILGSSALSSTQSSEISLALSERPGGDLINGAVTDGAGGIWVVGSTSNTVAASADAFQRNYAGAEDGFLAHIGADGTVLYASYLGGSLRDVAYSIARDPAGNLYVAGRTDSANFPTSSGALHPTAPGSLGTLNGFVMKFDPTGKQMVYSTYLGGTDLDQVFGVAADSAGQAHLVGMTWSNDFPITTSRCLQTTSNAFYYRLSANGSSLLFGMCLDDAEARAVTVDSSGDAYVVGLARQQFSPRINAVKVTSTSSQQGFVTKFSGSSIPFSTFIGGSSFDWANGVAVNSNGIYIAGGGMSTDYPGAAVRSSNDMTAWVMKVRLDGQAILGTSLLDGPGSPGSAHEEALALQIDSSQIVHVTGWTNSSGFPTTSGAAQSQAGGFFDAFYATIPMPQNVVEAPAYVTYLGGSERERGGALALDGSGGAWIGGDSYSANFPLVNAKKNAASPAFVARFGTPRTSPGTGSDIVLYARDASVVAGNWHSVEDASAAGGTRLWNPDAGIPKITTPSDNPANYFELTFQADAGVPYHLWLRMKADNDYWGNDSVWAQFTDSVDGSGNPIWRIGSASGTVVSLEDCIGCGEQGWGWNDNGYDTAGIPVVFASTGVHTIRIQQREDGISIDQIVLSGGQWATAPPGANRNDATILPQSTTPPPDSREIVMYVASDRIAGGTNWQTIQDTSAAGGARLFNPDQEQPKLTSPTAAGSDYFEVQFTAEAGVAYRLWVRSQALNDHWQNDSVFVQFSGSVDASGAPTFGIGSGSATIVSLEDCGGCGEQGWGWNDNGYNTSPTLIYFATSGTQTIRVLRREDGISIDQIVLSSVTFMNQAPGTPKNDSTIVPR